MKKNFAFISYNHKDVKYAKKLRRKLEWYRLPSEIHNEFEDSRYIRPVFRDRDELNSGILGAELKTRLENSKYLIVVCSPNSAMSDWVSDEVQAFISMNRVEYIIPYIIDGAPQKYNDKDAASCPLIGECFPKSLRLWNLEHPKESILGISIEDDGESNESKAFIRLVSRLIDVDFETLWRRHVREIRAVISVCAIVALISLFLAYWFMIPLKLSVTIMDDKSVLPLMEKGVLTVNENEYSVSNLDTTIVVGALPGYYRLRTVPVSFASDRFYESVNEHISLGMGISQNYMIQMKRDSSFAIYAGHVFYEKNDNVVPLGGATVQIGNKTTTTDQEGYFRITFPLPEQTECKTRTISCDGFSSNYIDEEEWPSDSLSYILHKE